MSKPPRKTLTHCLQIFIGLFTGVKYKYDRIRGGDPHGDHPGTSLPPAETITLTATSTYATTTTTATTTTATNTVPAPTGKPEGACCVLYVVRSFHLIELCHN